MSAIHIPRRHLIQPQGRLRLRHDWVGRVVSLVHFGTGRALDVADFNAAYTPSGSASFVSSQSGVGLKTGPGYDYIQSSGALAGFSGNFTLALYFEEFGATQDANGGMMWAIPAASHYTQLTSTGGIFFAGQGPYSLSSDPRGTRNTSIILRGAGSDPAFFVGRGKSTGVSASIASGAKTVRIGAWSSSGWNFSGTYGSVALVNGSMSDAEVMELVEYPWMFYAIDPARFYSFPSGPITLTSLMMSAFTSSGARATLGIAR